MADGQNPSGGAAGGVPAVDGWFTDGDAPALVGLRCSSCATVYFPPNLTRCRNPECWSTDLDRYELARTGTVWSYTDARYQPPPPFVAADPYEPFAIAAVELDGDQLVVLGQVADGFGLDDLAVGTPVELVVETLFNDGDNDRLIWRWKPRTTTEVSS